MSFLGRLFRQEPRIDNATAAIFTKLRKALGDEKYQNQLMPEELRGLLKAGENADILSTASGEFGRSLTNPIPVNGPLGEVTYLSSLVTPRGQPLFAHRIGSCDQIDIYETVSVDGRNWDVLYLSLYHPRRSRLAPSPYKFRTPDVAPMVFATNDRVSDFPHEMQRSISDWTRSTLGLPVVSPLIRASLQSHSYLRPAEHVAKMERVIIHGHTEGGKDARVGLLRKHVDENVREVSAVMHAIVGNGLDSAEVTFFTASVAVYSYLRFGQSEPDERMLNDFQRGLVIDAAKRSLSYGEAVALYQTRYREYSSLFDAWFEDGADQKHEMVTTLMHAVERATGQSAQGRMVAIHERAATLAYFMQQSIDFARTHLRPSRGR